MQSILKYYLNKGKIINIISNKVAPAFQLLPYANTSKILLTVIFSVLHLKQFSYLYFLLIVYKKYITVKKQSQFALNKSIKPTKIEIQRKVLIYKKLWRIAFIKEHRKTADKSYSARCFSIFLTNLLNILVPI